MGSGGKQAQINFQFYKHYNFNKNNFNHHKALFHDYAIKTESNLLFIAF